MRIVDKKYGMITSIVGLDGNEYQDWRKEYLNLPGLILLLASESRSGHSYIYFFPHEPENRMQRFIRTSRGVIEEGEQQIIIKTVNSIYCLEKDENCISAVDKVFLNAFAMRRFMPTDR